MFTHQNDPPYIPQCPSLLPPFSPIWMDNIWLQRKGSQYSCTHTEIKRWLSLEWSELIFTTDGHKILLLQVDKFRITQWVAHWRTVHYDMKIRHVCNDLNASRVHFFGFVFILDCDESNLDNVDRLIKSNVLGFWQCGNVQLCTANTHTCTSIHTHPCTHAHAHKCTHRHTQTKSQFEGNARK